jgi:hypothetical protein
MTKERAIASMVVHGFHITWTHSGTAKVLSYSEGAIRNEAGTAVNLSDLGSNDTYAEYTVPPPIFLNGTCHWAKNNADQMVCTITTISGDSTVLELFNGKNTSIAITKI